MISGKYPPILWKDDDFAYPEEKAEDVRVITVGELNGNLATGRYFVIMPCKKTIDWNL